MTSSTAATSALSDKLLKLMEQLNSAPGYTPKTSEQIREQAAGEYKSYYDTARQTAQQTFERGDLALQQQKEGLGASYDKLREDSAKQYAKAYSQTDRAMLGRGMQRSSYGAQTLANLLQEGAEAQQDIGDAQAAAEGEIDAQRTQLAEQLAAQLGQYNLNEQADILARIRELEDQEYDRGLTAQNREDSVALQLYQLMYQEGRDKVTDEQWQKQFDESVRQYNEQQKKSGGGGSSGTKHTDEASTEQGNGSNGNDAANVFQTFLDMLNAGVTTGPAKKPSSSVNATVGAVTGAHSVLNTVTQKEKLATLMK